MVVVLVLEIKKGLILGHFYLQAATGVNPPLPAHLADLYERTERFSVLPNDQVAIERFVRSHGRAARRGAA